MEFGNWLSGCRVDGDFRGGLPCPSRMKEYYSEVFLVRPVVSGRVWISDFGVGGPTVGMSGCGRVEGFLFGGGRYCSGGGLR